MSGQLVKPSGTGAICPAGWLLTGAGRAASCGDAQEG